MRPASQEWFRVANPPDYVIEDLAQGATNNALHDRYCISAGGIVPE
jgi:hypothetical protein